MVFSSGLSTGADALHIDSCYYANERSVNLQLLRYNWYQSVREGAGHRPVPVLTKRYVIFSIYDDFSLMRCGLFAKPNVGLPRVRPPVVTGLAARPNPATSTTKMASEMEVVTSMEDNMTSTLSIGSFGGRTRIEVHGEDITPEDVEGWSASGKRIKQIMAGKENGESATITRQSRPKTRASFAKRVAASVTKAARMPIDMPKEDTKYKMPYVVKKRQWERKMEAMQQQPDPESSPLRRASPAERPRGESKQRDSSRKRDDSKIGRSASRRRKSQSRERGSWADAVKANMAEKRQPPAQNAAKKIQEVNGVEKSLRDENEKLKRRIAEQDATIKEINEKLTTLIAMQQQQQQQQQQPQQPTPAQQRKQEMTEDEPEVEVDPRAAIAAGPAPKRRAIEGAKERKITERIEKHGDRLDHLEATSKVTNERLTALEQTVQQMTTNIQSTIQNMIAQMQTQLQAHIQAQMQSMEAQIIAKLQQSWPGQHA
ncbi:hypothetical protein HPB49_005584 [Dermacentor silvarum]|uniref:Uncharacterized protein n=1 Tax=Dermacentor silvarum TaxID=543639 RepID=A0ACB8DW17_DERSI|nr:hypothetical protein HPB49_005584 [Dermacentor silvarum]